MQESRQPSEPDIKKHSFSWLTVEVGLYLLILAVALALRVIGLGRGVMDEHEAAQAWQAWRLINVHAAASSPTASAYSPLLLTAQAVLFALFGASDVTARLFPALIGGVASLLPALLRDRLGRQGALAAALTLAISPTLVYTARYGDGGGLLAAFLLAMITLMLAWTREQQPAYIWAGAICGVCALLADPRIVGAIIALAAVWAVERLVFRRTPFLLPGREIDRRRLALIIGVTLVLLATTLTLNPGGLGAWADFPARWLIHLQPVVNGQGWAYPLTALIIYEPLLLFLGLIGAVTLIGRRDEMTVLVWLALALLLLALLAGGRNAADVALVCAVLALLAGAAIETLAADWRKGTLIREGAFVGIALIIGVYVVLELAMYASALYRQIQAINYFYLWLLAVTLILVLLGLYITWFGPQPTWRALSATAALGLLLTTFAASVRLNFEHVNDPKELHIRVAPYVGVRDALQTMRKLAWQQAGYPISLPIAVEARLGYTWRWYLRSWERVEFVDTLSSEMNTPLVLTLASESTPTLGAQYIGQDFVVRKWWSPEFLDRTDVLTWWLYAKSSTYAVKLDSVILWTRMANNEQ